MGFGVAVAVGKGVAVGAEVGVGTGVAIGKGVAVGAEVGVGTGAAVGNGTGLEAVSVGGIVSGTLVAVSPGPAGGALVNSGVGVAVLSAGSAGSVATGLGMAEGAGTLVCANSEQAIRVIKVKRVTRNKILAMLKTLLFP